MIAVFSDLHRNIKTEMICVNAWETTKIQNSDLNSDVFYESEMAKATVMILSLFYDFSQQK